MLCRFHGQNGALKGKAVWMLEDSSSFVRVGDSDWILEDSSSSVRVSSSLAGIIKW